MLFRSGLVLLALAAFACAGNDDPTNDPIVPGIDGGTNPDLPDAPRGDPDPGTPDAPVSPDPGTPDAPIPDPGTPDAPPTPGTPDGPPGPNPDEPPVDPDERFLTAPPPAACTPEVAATWIPDRGFSGGIPGTKTCGPNSPNCPTTYIPGNSGAPCSVDTDCTGPDPVCMRGDQWGTGTCAARGCELGSNFGCPERSVCINGGDGQTYCVGGCGIDQSGCFVGCDRDGFSCFNTESRSLGTCFATAGIRQCDPSASPFCSRPDFGGGICVQTSWDDQTVGRCFETCDPIRQDCTRSGDACYVLREYSGTPVCFQTWGYPEGAECDRMTECAEGLRCGCDVVGQSPCQTGLICRRYCALDGSTTCPSGTFCTPLASGSRWGSCLPPQP
jgi:hypothetical protein